MTDLDGLAAEAVQLVREHAPDWTVTARLRDVDGQAWIQIRALHPASAGLFWSHPATESLLPWLEHALSSERELALASQAPELIDSALVLGLRNLTKRYEWPAEQLQAVAFLLYENGAITEDEAAWLAGYVAHDAPMRATSPLGPLPGEEASA